MWVVLQQALHLPVQPPVLCEVRGHFMAPCVEDDQKGAMLLWSCFVGSTGGGRVRYPDPWHIGVPELPGNHQHCFTVWEVEQ